MSEVKTGQTVSVHYVGTFEDGTEFDSSVSRGAPITFQVGAGQMIAGFDQAVVGMTTNETKDITLTPDSAYGSIREDLVQNISTKLFPDDFEFIVGATVKGDAPNGQPLLAAIVAHQPENNVVVLDFNHPMAGKTLNFNINVVAVNDTAAADMSNDTEAPPEVVPTEG
jgi:peptidylprolyl isomerase